MMDDPTANKGHIPCQSWVFHNGWSTTTAQGTLLNPVATSQHLSLGSSSNQGSSYNHLQVPNQSCMRDPGTLLSTNNTHQSAMYKATQASSTSSSDTLFAKAVMPSVSQINPFAQGIPHTSSMLHPVNQGKTIPSLFHTQRNQNLPISSPSWGRRVGTSQTALEGAIADFASAGCTQSFSSSTSREQCQWIPSSLSRGAVSESNPTPPPIKEQAQEEDISPRAVNERQRLSLLNRRAQLLQQLAELDKALESMPPEDSSASQTPHTAHLSHPSMEESSQCVDTRSSDDQQDQLPTEKSELRLKKDHNSGESEDGDHSDDPVSDVDFSEFIPDPAGFSSDDSNHSRPATPVDEKPVLPTEEPQESGSPLCKPSDVGSPVKTKSVSPKKSSKIVVARNPNSKEKRANGRKNYCLFCFKPVTKLPRHLEAIHSDKPEVAVAFQYPKKSKERQKIWKRLINQGNFIHNKEVLKKGEGQLAARKRPNLTRQAQDFVHCLHCRGLFLKRYLWKHKWSCPDRVKNENKSEDKGRRILSLCAMEALDDLNMTDGLKNILSVMQYDDVARAIMDDPVVLQLGELFCKQHGSDEKKHEYIRQNIRQAARLVLEAQKASPMKKLEDFFVPSNFPHVVSSVKVLAGYDQERKTYKAPSLAVKLGYSLQKACAIVEANAVKRGDESAAESARKFLSVYQAKWSTNISSCALKTLRKTKLQKEKKVPLARDVKRLNSYLEKVHEAAETKLRGTTSTENYTALCKAVLARTILFNRRCAREVSHVELKDFMSRKKSSSQTGMDASVSEMERAMCGLFTRIDIRGKCGRTVPIFLKPSFESALELLVDVRKVCGVSEKNLYLFARTQGLSAYHGSNCIQRYARSCGAENPEVLDSKKIRKHYAEMIQMMNLDENEANQILGSTNRGQTLQQASDQHEGAGLQSNERLNQAASWDVNERSSSHRGPSTFHPQQAHGRGRGNERKTPQQRIQADSKGSKGKAVHRTWEKAEVEAVERHMMRFIKKHKVPQKDDCVDCLEAEPEALSTRTWKGVKDYVRNRITALKRTSKANKKL